MTTPTLKKIFKQVALTILGSLGGICITLLAVWISDFMTPKYAIALVSFVAGWTAKSLYDEIKERRNEIYWK